VEEKENIAAVIREWNGFRPICRSMEYSHRPSALKYSMSTKLHRTVTVLLNDRSKSIRLAQRNVTQ